MQHVPTDHFESVLITYDRRNKYFAIYYHCYRNISIAYITDVKQDRAINYR